MNIMSVKRNAGYGSWTIVFMHDGKEYVVVVKLVDKHLVYEDPTGIPSFALDLIRNNLSLRGEIQRGFLNESYCRVTEANW